MNISCIVDVASREVSFQDTYRIASYDHNVDVIHFSVEPIEDFSLDLSSIKIAAQGPNKARHDYAVDPSTVAIEEETGYITFDWPIPQGVTEMPLDAGFKYGDRGQLIFAVCAEIIDGSTVSKAWHSDDGIITVVAHLEPESGGGEDPEEEATNAQKIAQLQTNVAVMGTQIGALANGSPTPVSTVAEMADESAVYLYTGSETGYTAGNWYYYNGSAWTSGGEYGGAVTDTTLSISGAPADAKAVGEALADKADADDLTALGTRVTDVEGDIDDLKEDLNDVTYTLSKVIPFTINNNKHIENGSLINGTVSNSLRASTDVINVFADVIYVVPQYGCTINVGARKNDTWYSVETFTDATEIDLSEYDAFYIRAISTRSITYTDDALVYLKVVDEIVNVSNNVGKLTVKLVAVSNETAINIVGSNLFADSTPKIIQNDAYVSIMFACQSGRTYTVTREYGNRFFIVCTSITPAKNVPCEEVVSGSALNSYSFVPPAGAKYVIVGLQNDMAGASSHTHEEIIASCTVHTYSAVDYDAREASEQVSANYERLVVDANNSDYWAIMGLGSAGENYTPRNWNISSNTYLSNIISVTTDDGYATRYALYNSNKQFIYRSGFYRDEILISSLMEEYSATYVRFEVQALDESGAEIKTPIDNVSRYAHVHLYVLRDSGIEVDGASKKWYEDSLVQSTYLDRIKQAKYAYVNTDSGETPHPVLTLLHFSDVHGNADAMQYALAINDIFANDIDDMLHTGDVVTANLSDGISNWISSGCANKVLNVIGNHDTEENLVLQAAGKDNVYNTIFAPYISQWGVTQPTGVDTSGSDNYHALYYYKDYSAAEVRLIVLDTNFWDTAQKSWLTSVLTDAKTNGLCVVIACHNVKLLTELTDSNFSSYTGTGITETGNSYANQPSDWLDPVDDFINGGGNFACILAGHNHDGHMGTMTNYPDIFVYVSDKASVARVSGAARITGEMNANAVSIVVINPVEKLFKIVKIGAQIDGKMRPQNVFCYNYETKTIISQW